MAKLRELIIKISANSSSFQSEIARASRMGENYYRIIEQGGRRASGASREMQRAIHDLNGELSSIKNTVSGVAGAFAGAFATQQLINYADTWSQLSGRLKLASTSMEDFKQVQQELMTLSQRTGTSIAANTNLYSRVAQSMRDAGYASSDVAKVTETIATSLKLSGASTQEASSVITQLSQALASGLLRGEEFNAVMENGGRLAKMLADGLGTTIGGLREMSQNGLLTMDKIVPILTNTQQLRAEFAQLPTTVSGSAQKIENAFMAWIGNVNETSGATRTLSTAMEGIANNIDGIASVSGVLIGLGLARYFGGLTTSVANATIGVARATKSEIAHAQAQLQGIKISTARARAAVYRAQQARLAAQSVEQQALAERRLASAQGTLNRNISARRTVQENLNRVTSVGTRLLGGAMGLIGGVPGLVMAGATAWYIMHQRQQEARRSALEYANTLDTLKERMPNMTLSQSHDESKNIKKTLEVQIEEYEKQIAKIKNMERGIVSAQREADNLPEGVARERLQWRIKETVSALAVETQRLSQMEQEKERTTSALNAVDSQRNFLIRQQDLEQNKTHQSLLLMNAEQTKFNQIMNIGNSVLATRQALVNIPMRIPNATLTDKQQALIDNSERNKTLSSLSGEDKIVKQAEFSADDAGLLNTPEFADARREYIENQVEAYRSQQKLNESLQTGKATQSAYEKAQKEAERTAEQYERKIADLSVATEVQKVRASQGEKAASLYAASHENGAKWTDKQREAIERSSVALAEWTQKADDAVKKHRDMEEARKKLQEATVKFNDEATLATQTNSMSSREKSYFEESQQIDRIYNESAKKTEDIEARSKALDALDLKYRNIALAESDWTAGITRGMKDWVQESGNYAAQTASVVQNAMGGMVDTISDKLNGNKASWKDWSVSVLKSIQNVLINAAIVNSLNTMAGAGGWMGAVGGFLGGVAHAKGGVHSSESLGSYSNQIVSSPTYFAFAKGGAPNLGLMGEAGSEAIMPLTRTADGNLGVRVVGGNNQGAPSAPQVYITIDGNGNSETQSTNGFEQFGAEIGRFVDSRYRELMSKDIRPGGLIWNATRGGR
ncbi:phage tail tape measure protein [Proteus genomosp. 6]|uniref:phage tail tape measure protein n=1 Tax=Proteus genomosp. 6 TaxID=1311820 RepID=UPI000D68B949|nr:phage tail tape measure protein [Proteus genomosp. 6]